jgi:hypothetical protein
MSALAKISSFNRIGREPFPLPIYHFGVTNISRFLSKKLTMPIYKVKLPSVEVLLPVNVDK